MDPLSDIISLLRPRSYFSAGLDAGGDWAIQFAAHEGIKFNAIVSGTCLLTVEGVSEPVRLSDGDCFLLASGRPFRLASDLAIEPIKAETIYASAKNGIARCNGGGDLFLLGSRFGFSGHDATILLSMLPPIVHVRQSSDHASVLRWSLEQITRELREQRPGRALMTDHLAHVMLMQVMRMHIDAPDTTGVGWLFALRDRHMAAAIAAIHSDPVRRWTLEHLARVAGLSRSVFALRFRRAVGLSPMAYLTSWRMNLACDRLVSSSDNVATIGHSIGFESESAFCAAFRKAIGCSPRQYARKKEAMADTTAEPYRRSACENQAA